MLLALDIGNSDITMGLWKDGVHIGVWCGSPDYPDHVQRLADGTIHCKKNLQLLELRLYWLVGQALPVRDEHRSLRSLLPEPLQIALCLPLSTILQ